MGFPSEPCLFSRQALRSGSPETHSLYCVCRCWQSAHGSHAAQETRFHGCFYWRQKTVFLIFLVCEEREENGGGGDLRKELKLGKTSFLFSDNKRRYRIHRKQWSTFQLNVSKEIFALVCFGSPACLCISGDRRLSVYMVSWEVWISLYSKTVLFTLRGIAEDRDDT